MTNLAFAVLAAVPRGGAAVGRRGAGAQVEGDLGPHHTQTIMIFQESEESESEMLRILISVKFGG